MCYARTKLFVTTNTCMTEKGVMIKSTWCFNWTFTEVLNWSPFMGRRFFAYIADQARGCLRAYAYNEGPDQPAQDLHRIPRDSVLLYNIVADSTVLMQGVLICAFRTESWTTFRLTRPTYPEIQRLRGAIRILTSLQSRTESEYHLPQWLSTITIHISCILCKRRRKRYIFCRSDYMCFQNEFSCIKNDFESSRV